MTDTKKAPRKAATFQGTQDDLYIQDKFITDSPEMQEKSFGEKLIPARPGEVFSLGGKSYPVTGYLSVDGMPTVPLVDIPMMTDYQWQLFALESRLQHPENYAPFEDVAETVANLRQWLKENAPEGKGAAV